MMPENPVKQAMFSLQQNGQLAAVEVNAAAIRAFVDLDNPFEVLFDQICAAFRTSHPVLT
jgi:hypothetical protein